MFPPNLATRTSRRSLCTLNFVFDDACHRILALGRRGWGRHDGRCRKIYQHYERCLFTTQSFSNSHATRASQAEQQDMDKPVGDRQLRELRKSAAAVWLARSGAPRLRGCNRLPSHPGLYNYQENMRLQRSLYLTGK